jgi:hypothetical protein
MRITTHLVESLLVDAAKSPTHPECCSSGWRVRCVMKQFRMGNLRLISVMLNTLENWRLLTFHLRVLGFFWWLNAWEDILVSGGGFAHIMQVSSSLLWIVHIWRGGDETFRMGSLRLINILETWCLLHAILVSTIRGQWRIIWNYRLTVLNHVLRTGWLRSLSVGCKSRTCQPATKGVAWAVTSHSTRVRQRSFSSLDRKPCACLQAVA